MSRIANRVFGPRMDKVSPELIPENRGTIANNMRLVSGALEPLKTAAAVAGVTLTGASEIKSIYRFGKDISSKTDYWFQFTTDVDVVKGPIAGDTEERTYWTDGVYPKKTKSSLAGLVAGQGVAPASLRMGVPPPGWAGPTAPRSYTPGVTVAGTATDGASVATNSVYVVTYVSTWDEESAPSNASAIATWRAGQNVTITLPGNISGAYSIDRIRIYRSVTGSSRTAYQLLTTLPVATASYVDTSPSATLGETCPSWDWLPPPDGLKGLVDMGNGVLAGFDQNTVYFCEPNYPYAWPVKYDSTVSAPIVGLAVFGQTLVVGTTEGITLITGSDPAAMSQDTPKGLRPVVSKRSMVEMMGGVVYASSDGLYYVGPSGNRNLTESFISRDYWATLGPASFTSCVRNGEYYAFADNQYGKIAYIFNLGEDAGYRTSTEWASATYFEKRTDSLFIVKFSAGANTLCEWDTGTNLTSTWKSKDYRYFSGAQFARAQVIADTYPVTFILTADGATKYTYSVPDSLPFPLPDGRNYKVAYALQATGVVRSVRMASSLKELGDV